MRELAPALSDAAYSWLHERGLVSDQWIHCCGLPLKFGGQDDSFQAHTKALYEEMLEGEIDEVVTACPSCYRTLSLFSETYGSAPKVTHLSELMVAEGMRISPDMIPEGAVCAIHDSCPDRKTQITARAVREIARDIPLVEMKHSRERTMCCGIGEPFFGADQEVQIRQVNRRSQEAVDAGATHILNACVNCTLAFTLGDAPVESVHYLELLLGETIPRNVYRDTHGDLS